MTEPKSDADDVSKETLFAISAALDRTAEAAAEILGPNRAVIGLLFAAAYLARTNGIGYERFCEWVLRTKPLFEATKRRTQ
jgi:hypothetical protein